jgi:hypothetical protein
MSYLKPSWMPSSQWAPFLEKHLQPDGLLHCAVCGTTDDITVDHIVARVNGGGSEAENLQPMCRKHNSSKGSKPDSYWGNALYFDASLNRSKMRVAQDDFVYRVIEEYEEFFSRPIASINRKLFLYAQIVGAGKTLGMFCLPFALNAAIGIGRARIDKMLIVTKDTPLRSQIAKEMRNEPADFGIVSQEPSVLEITSLNDLVSNDTPHDIAVMCPNMLWPETDGSNVTLSDTNARKGEASEVFVNWREHMSMVLRKYPLIVFDETHYAHANIAKLVHVATNNLVFGFTASPVKANGELLDDMILMSSYGYHEAAIHDRSMKWLGHETSAELGGSV